MTIITTYSLLTFFCMTSDFDVFFLFHLCRSMYKRQIKLFHMIFWVLWKR